MVVIEAMQKIVAFVRGRKDIEIRDMTLEIDPETNTYRKAYVGGRIGRKDQLVTIYVELPLAKDDGGDWSIDHREMIMFSVGGVTSDVHCWLLKDKNNCIASRIGSEDRLAEVCDKLKKL